jgi:DNA polymerase III delta prime subunit
MAHHAYYVSGETEQGIARARTYVSEQLGIEVVANPDVMLLRHGLLSVDDARKIRSIAELSPTTGSQKVLIISAIRLFHEAQNALLKLFEEPPAGTVLILIIPSEGMLLPTLRSRLLVLPVVNDVAGVTDSISIEAQEFLKAGKVEREKIFTKIVDRSKSDKDDEKQAARLSAIRLVEGLMRDAHTKWQAEKASPKKKELQLLLEDLNAFIPILHERSAPLKLIFEHLQLVQ